MTREQKINILVVPITLGIVLIVTIVLLLCKQNWKFYLIGALLGCMIHGMMVKQSAKALRMSKLDPNITGYNPKKAATMWFLARLGVTVAVFAALVAISGIKENRTQAIIDIIIALGGLLTLKIVFIISLLVYREKVVKE